ncbi:hypothetical protein D3C81_1190790 [compost metagenome]
MDFFLAIRQAVTVGVLRRLEHQRVRSLTGNYAVIHLLRNYLNASRTNAWRDINNPSHGINRCVKLSGPRGSSLTKIDSTLHIRERHAGANPL